MLVSKKHHEGFPKIVLDDSKVAIFIIVLTVTILVFKLVVGIVADSLVVISVTS